ncbi:MAG: hypothetical protein ACHQUC_07465 [Chlamydiales bacterium]
MSSSSFTIQDVLTMNQQMTLSSLMNRDLKESIHSKLHDESMVGMVEIARITLNLLSKSTPSEARDRFFIHLLRETETTVSEQLKHLTTIVHSGFFNDFLLNVDTNKREYHSSKKLIRMIDQFCNITIPTLEMDLHRAPSYSSITELQLIGDNVGSMGSMGPVGTIGCEGSMSPVGTIGCEGSMSPVGLIRSLGPTPSSEAQLEPKRPLFPVCSSSSDVEVGREQPQ